MYLLDTRQLLDELRGRNVTIGVASSVRTAQWEAAQIYPERHGQGLRAATRHRATCAAVRPMTVGYVAVQRESLPSF